MKISNFSVHIVGLIHKQSFKKQFVFSKAELKNNGSKDPLQEERFTKVNGLIHRYHDRVVLTVTNKCFAYCRFCFRKNNWHEFDGFDLEATLSYLKANKQIREVLISGGDPFTLSDTKLERILEALKKIDTIQTIRIGTRVLTSNPKRISADTVKMLKKYSPIWIAVHINHPDEITKEFELASGLLTDNGIPIVSQTVLLKGINDDHRVLSELFCTLVKLRIKPYYLLGCDQAKGNEHFRVPIQKALNIMKKLRGKISGLCMPVYAFDLPNGGGKVVIEPQNIMERNKNIYKIRNFEGGEFEYRDV